MVREQDSPDGGAGQTLNVVCWVTQLKTHLVGDRLECGVSGQIPAGGQAGERSPGVCP